MNREGHSTERGEIRSPRALARFAIALVVLFGAPSLSSGSSLTCWRELTQTLPAPRLVVENDRRVVVQVAPPDARSAWLNGVARLAGWPLGVPQFSRLYFQAHHADPSRPGPTRLLDAMKVTVAVDPDALATIPRTGPLLVAANHPRSGVDGLAVADMLLRVRSDVKVMMNSFMTALPEVGEGAVAVGETRQEKVLALRQASEWLEAGHALVVFPAGAVSTVKDGDRYVDPLWMPGAARLAQRTDAPILPVHVDGGPTPFFMQMRQLHVGTSYLLLMREFLAQRGDTVRLTLRTLIAADEVAAMNTDDLLHRVREAVYDTRGDTE